MVERLAGFDSPAATLRSLREEFGATITRQSIEQYNAALHSAVAAMSRMR